VQDAVRINVERHFDLRHAARRGRDVRELELAGGLVVLGELAFALEHVDFHAGLIVAGGGENFRFARRDRGVALDQLGEHATERLDAERERGHVEQEHVLHFALEHAALDAGADGDDFVRVHALMRSLVDQLVCGFNDARHAGHTTDEHEFVNLVGADAGVLQAGLHGLDGALEQAVGELLHLGAGERFLDVLRPARVRRDERQIDVVGRRAGERDLGFLGFFLDALERVGLLAQVHAGFLLELVENPIHQRVVPVVTAEMRVAVGGFDFKDAVADFETEISNVPPPKSYTAIFSSFFLSRPYASDAAVGSLMMRRHFETRDAAGVFRGLTLRVVEVSGNSDDGLRDLFAQFG
jgi:hypothetical protein